MEVTNYLNDLHRESLRKTKPGTSYTRLDLYQIKRIFPDNDYITEIERREKQLQIDYKYYDEMKVKYEIQIKAKEDEFDTISFEIKTLQENLTVIQNKQIQYYCDLLKQGIDVRSDGLSWIVKNLIELNAILNNSIFPKFLENGHIEYLTLISKKSVEIMQLDIMRKCLKNSLNKKQTYNEFSYIVSPGKKFKPKSLNSKTDVFSLITYEGLQDEDNLNYLTI